MKDKKRVLRNSALRSTTHALLSINNHLYNSVQLEIDELRFNLRKKDGSSQRRIMRTYGANFHYLKGEPVDEENL